ncbi:MAG: Zn-ribbon containing protein [Halobacteriaceae archaeon]
MPHQCTECGHTFPDGSKEMLSGCPDCGGNKFQYFPGEVPEDPPDSEPPEADDPGVTGRVGRAAKTVRDLVDGEADSERDSTPPSETEWPETARPDPDSRAARDHESPGDDSIDDPPSESPPADGAEDRAQTTARSEVVDDESLPSDIDGEVVSAPAEERPDMETLREELDDQFESIRIVERGQYELNLMELYDREEYIIALKENGRYVIEVPDAWRGSDS